MYKNFENKLFNIEKFLLLYLASLFISSSFLKDIIFHSGYHLNEIIFYRLIGYLILVGLYLLFPIINRIYFRENIENKTVWYTGFVVLLFGFLFIVSLLIKSSIIDSVLYLISFLIIAFYSYGFFHQSFPILERIKNRVFLLLILSLALVCLPLMADKQINSETNPNLEELQIVDSKVARHDLLQNNLLDLRVNGSDLDLLKTNLKRIDSQFIRPALAAYKVTEINGNYIYNFDFNRGSLQNMCLFVDYTSINNGMIFKNIDHCIKYMMGLGDQGDFIEIQRAISIFPFAKNSIADVFLDKAKSINFDNAHISGFDKAKVQLHIMLVRGAILHHYDYILYTLRNSVSNFDFFTNQYGFGPLYIVNETSKVSGLSLFDSLFLSIVLVNAFVLLVVIMFFRKDEAFHKVLIGFSLSIAITYATSGYLAPFLFFIRYLPSLILVLFACSKIKNGFMVNKVEILFFALLSFLAAIYNFEYGLLTTISILFVGISNKNKLFIKVGLISILLTLVTKFLPHSLNVNGMSYLSTLAGTGQGESFSLISLLYLFQLLIVGYLFNVREEAKGNSDYLKFIFTVLLIFSFKIVWTGSENHIGPLFLVLFLVLHGLNSQQSFNEKEFKLVKIVYFIAFIFALSSSFKILLGNNPGQKFNGVTYVRSNISSFFKITKANDQKLKAFKDIYKKGDLLLSHNDHLLSITTGITLTKPYPNVSTNINSPVDITDIYLAYTQDGSHRVLFDKSIFNQDLNGYISNRFVGLDSALDGQVNGYFYENYKFLSLYSKFLDASYYVCQENEMFIALCSNK